MLRALVTCLLFILTHSVLAQAAAPSANNSRQSWESLSGEDLDLGSTPPHAALQVNPGQTETNLRLKMTLPGRPGFSANSFPQR
jgi:hypothetical protein